MILTERIKSFLRSNRYYTTYFQTHVNDLRYFARDCKRFLKDYQFKKDKEVEGHTLYFIIDSSLKHPGLVDRFKAIVGLYYIAKENGFTFKVIFENPFLLQDYLSENLYPWIGDKSELSYSYKNVRLTSYNGGGKIPKLDQKVKQYHVYNYIGYDILLVNKIDDYSALWGKLFRDLFTPHAHVQKMIDSIGIPENSYIAIHLRFVNALENFEQNHFNVLMEEEQEDLIQRCLAGVGRIKGKHPNMQVLVFSDSQRFLERVKTLPVTVLDGKIGHVSFVSENQKEEITKTFVDFFMLSRASKVYCIMAAEMYRTVFSYYAAVSGGKEYQEFDV